MDKSDCRYEAYLKILKEELIPAMGCTEPISLAYGAAYARKVLGNIPERVVIEASGNLIKNVKSVIVPNTGELKGIPAALAAGIVAGDHEKCLEVIACVTEEQKKQIKEYIDTHSIEVRISKSPLTFNCVITLYYKEEYVKLRIANFHTNVVLLEKNGEKIIEREVYENKETELTDRSKLSIEAIIDFANTVDLEDVKEMLDKQIKYNSAIAEEGLKSNYGANIGKVILEMNPTSVEARAKAKAAAGSDARMNGCELPVVIVSGSGNQGITASVPVIEYAKELGASQELLYRSLVVSNLTTIHQKTGIGRLSAFCGAVLAGVGSAAGICYISGGGYEEIKHTIVNALGIASGIVCDGAKSSCAAKIALSVEAGILGYNMFIRGQQFWAGDGIISNGVEPTIVNVGRLGREGMRETDQEILNIMIGNESC